MKTLHPGQRQVLRIPASPEQTSSRNVFLPASDHQLPFGGPFPDFGVDVHGEERAGAVEDGGQRAHQRGQHDGQHQSSQPWSGTQEDGSQRILLQSLTIKKHPPLGIRSTTSLGYAMLVQPTVAPQCFRHSSGFTQATSSGWRQIRSARRHH